MECLALAGVRDRADSLPAASFAGVFRSKKTFSHPSCCFLVRLEQAGRRENMGGLYHKQPNSSVSWQHNCKSDFRSCSNICGGSQVLFTHSQTYFLNAMTFLPYPRKYGTHPSSFLLMVQIEPTRLNYVPSFMKC